MGRDHCRVCGCTDADCRRCIEKTGAPCAWVEPGLCSACYPSVELRRALDQMVQLGQCSQAEADETFRFMDELSNAELRGDVSAEQALALVELLGVGQLERRAGGAPQ